MTFTNAGSVRLRTAGEKRPTRRNVLICSDCGALVLAGADSGARHLAWHTDQAGPTVRDISAEFAAAVEAAKTRPAVILEPRYLAAPGAPPVTGVVTIRGPYPAADVRDHHRATFTGLDDDTRAAIARGLASADPGGTDLTDAEAETRGRGFRAAMTAAAEQSGPALRDALQTRIDRLP